MPLKDSKKIFCKVCGNYVPISNTSYGCCANNGSDTKLNCAQIQYSRDVKNYSVK